MRRGTPLARTAFKRKTPAARMPTERPPRVLYPLYRVPAPFTPTECKPVEKGDFDKLAAYRAFVRSFPCFECKAPAPSICCHANEGKGIGLKVSDRLTFPLCPACHEALDQSKGMTREERRQRERRYVARMQELARFAGRKEIA